MRRKSMRSTRRWTAGIGRCARCSRLDASVRITHTTPTDPQARLRWKGALAWTCRRDAPTGAHAFAPKPKPQRVRLARGFGACTLLHATFQVQVCIRRLCHWAACAGLPLHTPALQHLQRALPACLPALQSQPHPTSGRPRPCLPSAACHS